MLNCNIFTSLPGLSSWNGSGSNQVSPTVVMRYGFLKMLSTVSVRVMNLPHIAGLGLLHSNHTPMAFAHQLRSQPAKRSKHVILCDDEILLISGEKNTSVRHKCVTFISCAFDYTEAPSLELKQKKYSGVLVLNEAPHSHFASPFLHRNRFTGWPYLRSIKFRQPNCQISSIQGMQQTNCLTTYAAYQVTTRWC